MPNAHSADGKCSDHGNGSDSDGVDLLGAGLAAEDQYNRYRAASHPAYLPSQPMMAESELEEELEELLEASGALEGLQEVQDLLRGDEDQEEAEDVEDRLHKQ